MNFVSRFSESEFDTSLSEAEIEYAAGVTLEVLFRGITVGLALDLARSSYEFLV